MYDQCKIEKKLILRGVCKCVCVYARVCLCVACTYACVRAHVCVCVYKLHIFTQNNMLMQSYAYIVQ